MSQAAVRKLLMPSTYANYLAQLFDDHVRLTAGTPLLPEKLGQYAEPLRVGDVLNVVKNCIAMADRPDWHLPFAKGMAEHFHGPVTMALVNAPTLGDGLEALVRYMPRRVPYHRWQASHGQGNYYCELVELIEFGPVREVVIEIPILVMHEYVHTIRGGQLEGAHVELRYPPTAWQDCYARFFDCPVHFDAPRNAMVVPEEWLAIRNVGYDEAAWQMALRRCAQTSAVAREQDTLVNVHRAIYDTIEGAEGALAPPTLSAVAARLHMSPRTLIRRLRSAGTTYQEVIDDIQYQRARNLLADDGFRVADVGAELGFRDPASFGRSFKRWSGMTPGAWRATMRGGFDE